LWRDRSGVPSLRLEALVTRPNRLAWIVLLAAGCFADVDPPPELGTTAAAIELNCRDGADQDSDGLADCADPECSADPYCAQCGDGDIDPPEVCDDGNLVSGDGCNSACRIEAGFTCRFPGQPCQATVCEVATVGTSAFLRGNFVEIGLNQDGAFGTYTDACPAGWHWRSGQEEGEIGFVADPEGTNWTAYHGDFFTPGTPEEGWAMEIAGTIYNNNRNRARQPGHGRQPRRAGVRDQPVRQPRWRPGDLALDHAGRWRDRCPAGLHDSRRRRLHPGRRLPDQRHGQRPDRRHLHAQRRPRQRRQHPRRLLDAERDPGPARRRR
jgi:cysteine-rich repeat protein